ncbi:tRNA delta(2)-isopentenylpyrophosphate transferase [Neisseria meningitidis 992008]|nr:tRNA delta(2)-isopentenylpyrophosphate transferase [Neisseria meningitidis 992008]
MPIPKAFALLGPTAGGKTALALKIAETLPVEIISLDSALVYTGMDIGTAKPSHAERSFVPHHLIDIIPPTESYSAARFVEDCTRLVGEISSRGRFALIVGGTMMYFRALTQGLNDLPEADACLRADLDEQKQMYGLDFLYRTLQKVDPETACRLKPNDSQRIGRALEVYYLTGKPMSEHLGRQSPHTLPFDLHTAALIPENRARLHENIALRFHLMLEQGFIDEVENLRRLYPSLTADSPAHPLCRLPSGVGISGRKNRFPGICRERHCRHAPTCQTPTDLVAQNTFRLRCRPVFRRHFRHTPD